MSTVRKFRRWWSKHSDDVLCVVAALAFAAMGLIMGMGWLVK